METTHPNGTPKNSSANPEPAGAHLQRTAIKNCTDVRGSRRPSGTDRISCLQLYRQCNGQSCEKRFPRVREVQEHLSKRQNATHPMLWPQSGEGSDLGPFARSEPPWSRMDWASWFRRGTLHEQARSCIRMAYAGRPIKAAGNVIKGCSARRKRARKRSVHKQHINASTCPGSTFSTPRRALPGAGSLLMDNVTSVAVMIFALYATARGATGVEADQWR